MPDLGRFQVHLVDRRAAPIAMLAGVFVLLGLLFAASAALPLPSLPEQPLPLTCSDRCPPLDQLPTAAQLRAVRAWQNFAWELNEPQDRFPMPAEAERLDRLRGDRELVELLGLMIEGRDPLGESWLERVLSERDWSRIDEGPPPPELEASREKARQEALADAEAEVQQLALLEERLHRAMDSKLALQREQIETERAVLAARIVHRRELASQLFPVALLGALLAFVLCVVATWKARGLSLTVTQAWLQAGSERKPTAWLRDFVLGPHETVLVGHDGARWKLPPVSPEEHVELHKALHLVLHPTSDALEQEQSQASRLAEQLGRLRQRSR
jgi:hypothetical protein